MRNKIITKGFTLVELLVAISILSLSILAAFTAVSNNIKGSNFSQDQITAYYLADEGIEFIRNVRDQNDIQNQYDLANGSGSVNWLAGIAATAGDPCGASKTCQFDSWHATLTSCGVSCNVLDLDPSTGLYNYVTGATTPFTRTITVTVNSSTEALVTVNVSWTTNSVSKTFSESEILRAWQ